MIYRFEFSYLCLWGRMLISFAADEKQFNIAFIIMFYTVIIQVSVSVPGCSSQSCYPSLKHSSKEHSWILASKSVVNSRQSNGRVNYESNNYCDHIKSQHLRCGCEVLYAHYFTSNEAQNSKRRVPATQTSHVICSTSGNFTQNMIDNYVRFIDKYPSSG